MHSKRTDGNWAWRFLSAAARGAVAIWVSEVEGVRAEADKFVQTCDEERFSGGVCRGNSAFEARRTGYTLSKW